MGRLLRVIRAALPASEEQAGGGGPGGAAVAGAGGAPGQEPWRQHAEQEGELRVLTWSGIGYSNAVWCARYGILYQVGVRAAWGPAVSCTLAASNVSSVIATATRANH